MSNGNTIKVMAFEGRLPIADFDTEHLPDVGDMLTIQDSQKELGIYVVEKRGFFIDTPAGTDRARIEFLTIRVRKATQDEEDHWFDR